MKFLVVTNKSDDAHADFMIEALTQRGYGQSIVRLNTEDFATNTHIRFDGSHIHVDLLDSGCSFSTQDVGAVWFRRPKKIEVTHSDPGVKAYIFEQYTSILDALYFELEKTAFWFNTRSAIRSADAKLEQLLRAKEIGFHVPRSFVCNNHSDIAQIEAIIQQDTLCTKSLQHPYYYQEESMYALLTRKVSLAQLEKETDSIDICPIYLQEYIDKQYDIRVVVLGEQVYAFKLYSQDTDLSIEDFRGVAPHLIHHEYMELPDDIRQKVVAFVQSYGLFYSAIDLVMDKTGELYFIENNPNGQWLWLELLTEVKISDGFLDIIIAHLNQTKK